MIIIKIKKFKFEIKLEGKVNLKTNLYIEIFEVPDIILLTSFYNGIAIKTITFGKSIITLIL